MFGGAFFLSLCVVGLSTDDLVIESKVQTLSGLIQRFRDAEDERFFLVKLTDRKTQVEIILEDHLRNFSSNSRTERVTNSLLANEGASTEFLLLREGDNIQLLGESKRIFEKAPCSALGRVHLPTPKSRADFYILNDLNCADPLDTDGEKMKVVGRADQNWLTCESENRRFCFWRPHLENSPEASVQLATYAGLWRAEGELMLDGVDAFLPKIEARSWAFDSNRSLYDANQKILFFGSGNHPDGLDAFIVSHEWTHFLIDQLNTGLVGRSAEIIHEGLADFFAANMFNSPCFAPYEAMDSENGECFRNLDNELKFPKDMIGSDPHRSSLILSGALWDARKFIPAPLMTEILVEAAIRLPKIPDLMAVWPLIENIYARFLTERELLQDHRAEIHAIGISRGLLTAQ